MAASRVPSPLPPAAVTVASTPRRTSTSDVVRRVHFDSESPVAAFAPGSSAPNGRLPPLPRPGGLLFSRRRCWTSRQRSLWHDIALQREGSHPRPPRRGRRPGPCRGRRLGWRHRWPASSWTLALVWGWRHRRWCGGGVTGDLLRRGRGRWCARVRRRGMRRRWRRERHLCGWRRAVLFPKLCGPRPPL